MRKCDFTQFTQPKSARGIAVMALINTPPSPLRQIPANPYASRRHKNLHAEFTQRFDMIGVVIEHHHLHPPARQQQTPGHLAQIVQTRLHNNPLLFVDSLSAPALPPVAVFPCESAAPENRRSRYRQRDRQRQRFCLSWLKYIRHLRRAKTTNANSPPSA
ncbi:hypothetical protein KCP69_24770 [Salmonella enterica subsp. enterica]|nr:hypothetical protein KCP69_24770 [Salmonella enterica subsp. enterica]